MELLQDELAESGIDGRSDARFRPKFPRAATTTQHVVHMGRFGIEGILLPPLSDAPTAKVDMSFFTSPWQSGQVTLLSCCITSLSKVY